MALVINLKLMVYKVSQMPMLGECALKDRHQWLGRELQYSLSWSVDGLFSKAIVYIVYH